MPEASTEDRDFAWFQLKARRLSSTHLTLRRYDVSGMNVQNSLDDSIVYNIDRDEWTCAMMAFLCKQYRGIEDAGSELKRESEMTRDKAERRIDLGPQYGLRPGDSEHV